MKWGVGIRPGLGGRLRHRVATALMIALLTLWATNAVCQENPTSPVSDSALGVVDLSDDQTSLEPLDGASQEPLAVFRGEVDVSLIGLFVSVVDSKGRPVDGLTKDDFRVFEHGELVEITNFEAVHRQELRPLDEVDGDGVTDDEDPEGRYISVLFDNPSLERKTRKRVIKALGDFIDEGLQQNDQFMIALNSGELEIVKPFTDNAAGLHAALQVVAEGPSGGDALKQSKRYLKRSVYAEDIYDVPMIPGAENPAVAASAIMRANRLLTGIEGMRRLEYDRINDALSVTDEMLRAMAGLKGRKAVIWIGEDLAIQPAYDIYSVWYSRVTPLRGVMTVDHPHVWGSKVQLDRQFATIAANAQAAGATIYVVDASDRDREMANADFTPSSSTSLLMSESAGNAWTPGTDFATVRQRTEGGSFMAVATGGEAFGNTRNIPSIMDTLADHVSTYYYIGYRRAGPADGRRHDVQVKVTGKGMRARHHEQVLDKTVPQKLADVAMSRLRLNLGDNGLDLAVQLQEPEPMDDKTFVLPIQLTMPVDKLVLLPDADNHIGQILVAVAVLDDDGKTAPVHLIRLRLTIPSARFKEGAIASQPIRLKLGEGTERIAVSVRDEISGVEASLAVPVTGLQL